uniref:Uncharacterized protein n=1 Tax=Oryza punctata TaxID=4537 RepID=A0A0E0JHS9_ORYPU
MFKKCMMDLHTKRTGEMISEISNALVSGNVDANPTNTAHDNAPQVVVVAAPSKDASGGTDSVRSSPSSSSFVMACCSESLAASDACDAPSFNFFDETDPKYINTKEMKDSTAIVVKVPSLVAQSPATASRPPPHSLAASRPPSPLVTVSPSHTAQSPIAASCPSTRDKNNRKKRARKNIDDGGPDEKKMRTTAEVNNVYTRCVTSMPNRRNMESSSDMPPPLFLKMGGFHVSLEYFRDPMKPIGSVDCLVREIHVSDLFKEALDD